MFAAEKEIGMESVCRFKTVVFEDGATRWCELIRLILASFCDARSTGKQASRQSQRFSELLSNNKCEA